MRSVPAASACSMSTSSSNEIDSGYLSLANVTTDTLRAWMIDGMLKFASTLQTTWPDLSGFHDAGGKVIHYHSEADNSIPTQSSTTYHNAVRSIMYPDLNVTAGFDAMSDWYRLFIVPGTGRCGPSTAQPGPWPTDVLGSVIAWVEKGVSPTTLNATVVSGPLEGEQQNICSHPLRPQWDNSGAQSCVLDESSLDVWTPSLNSIPLPVY